MTGGELGAGSLSGVLLSLAIMWLRRWAPRLSKPQLTVAVVAAAAVVGVVEQAITGNLHTLGDWLSGWSVVAGTMYGFYTVILKGLGLEAVAVGKGYLAPNYEFGLSEHPMTPMTFMGTIYNGGRPAADGTAVQTKVGDWVSPIGRVESVPAAGRYATTAFPPESYVGKPVEFYVAGKPTQVEGNKTYLYEPRAVVDVDLAY